MTGAPVGTVAPVTSAAQISVTQAFLNLLDEFGIIQQFLFDLFPKLIQSLVCGHSYLNLVCDGLITVVVF